MNTSDICTARLCLISITLPMMHAEEANLVGLAPLINAQIPSQWPPEYREPHVFEFMKRQYTESPHTVGWHRYVLLCAEPRILIGTVDGHPRSPSEAEIGYSLLSQWQRKGLVTEAVRAFIAWLFAGDTLAHITAQTFPHLIPSVRVLEKCGFFLDGHGDEPGALRFRLDKARWQHPNMNTG